VVLVVEGADSLHRLIRAEKHDIIQEKRDTAKGLLSRSKKRSALRLAANGGYYFFGWSSSNVEKVTGEDPGDHLKQKEAVEKKRVGLGKKLAPENRLAKWLQKGSLRPRNASRKGGLTGEETKEKVEPLQGSLGGFIEKSP